MTKNIDVAGRIRAIRKQLNMTQGELGEQAGLSLATIGKIERGEISPTIAALQKIAVCLRAPLAALIDDAIDGPRRIFFARKDLTVASFGKHTVRQVGRNLGRRALQMTEDTYEVGADTGEMMQSHAGEEAGFVIRGKLEVIVGYQSRVLGPGEAYFFESRLPHRFRNVGSEICVVVTATTPPN